MTIKEKILSYIQKDKEIKKEILKELTETNDFAKFKQLLFENRLCSEEDLLLIFSKEFRIPFLDLKKYKISPQNKELLPSEIAFKYKVIPLCKIGTALTIATSNPLDVIAYDDIKVVTNTEKVEIVLSKEEDILKVLELLYKGTIEEFERFFKELETFGDDTVLAEETKTSLEELINESKLPPIVRAIDLIIYNALRKRASDIHIEPQEDRLLVKYRIDGVLQEEFSFPKKNQQAVIARLKIISGLNITESRLPQDGRFKVKFEGREIDFRVSSLPVNFGEKFVLRVLDKESLSIGLSNLGFSQEPMRIFNEAIKAPFGIILVTGPTGSGKSTTLYSILNLLNQSDKNIVTIEDPIEYHIEGITQIQVNPEIGLSFAQGLRAVLRQSPDIIMVGEIRDSETADIAIKASLTGELIFSTLHTNNAVGAITRLIDMGIEPFLLASSLVATTAQRLVRKLCPKCKEPYKLDEETVKRLNIKDIKGDFFKAVGCSFCNNTGYKGRIAIIEILFFDDKMKDMVIQRTTEDKIVEYASKQRGFKLLREDGFLKCSEGITSIEEVLRVTTE
ncbi:MAG: GspE/PulE family protein [Candidatus Omnitrophica bacterium]|nr:GspE/PulE family protein [Candidatus Omnitrophota bacterium]